MKRGLLTLILVVLSFSIYAGSDLFSNVDISEPSTKCYDNCYNECASECDGSITCESNCDECCEDCCEPPPVVEKPPCTLVPPREGRPPNPGYEPNPAHYDVTWVCQEDQDIFTRPLFAKIEKEVPPQVYVLKHPVPDTVTHKELKPILTLMPMPRMEMQVLKNPLPVCYTSFIGRCHAKNIQEKLREAGVETFSF